MAQDDGKTFMANLDAWIAKTGGNLDALARQTAFEMSANVVRDTPVDTGFLRGSWQPSIGEPAGAPAARPEDPTAQVPPAAQLSMVISEIKAGDTFYMVNGAAYGMRVEYGFVGTDKLGRKYDQGGRYFVSENLARWPDVVDKVAKELAP
jgi:hypothetical protein